MCIRDSILVALAAIVAFVIAAAPHANPDNLSPFTPFGIRGVFSGASIVFFSYMGFDAVATSAEECKNPSRDLPIGIISSIAICMALYIAVSLALTAAVNYTPVSYTHLDVYKRQMLRQVKPLG